MIQWSALSELDSADHFSLQALQPLSADVRRSPSKTSARKNRDPASLQVPVVVAKRTATNGPPQPPPLSSRAPPAPQTSVRALPHPDSVSLTEAGRDTVLLCTPHSSATTASTYSPATVTLKELRGQRVTSTTGQRAGTHRLTPSSG